MPEQQAELKKLQNEYAAMIAELEAERDSKLALVLTKEQRETMAKLWARGTGSLPGGAQSQVR